MFVYLGSLEVETLAQWAVRVTASVMKEGFGVRRAAKSCILGESAGEGVLRSMSHEKPGKKSCAFD